MRAPLMSGSDHERCWQPAMQLRPGLAAACSATAHTACRGARERAADAGAHPVDVLVRVAARDRAGGRGDAGHGTVVARVRHIGEAVIARAVLGVQEDGVEREEDALGRRVQQRERVHQRLRGAAGSEAADSVAQQAVFARRMVF